MSDFNLVDPRGWEYDLQSVSHFAMLTAMVLTSGRSMQRTWVTFSCIAFPGQFDPIFIIQTLI